MTININGIEKHFENNKTIMLVILQIVAICNAIRYGWKVKKIGGRTYELSKIIDNHEQFNLEPFLDMLIFY